MITIRAILSAAWDAAREAAIVRIGGTTREREDHAVNLAAMSIDTASTLAGAIDDALAMAYDADGQCRDCCRGRNRGHAEYCGIALVLAPLIGTARAVVDRQHERAVETAKGGRAELQA